MAEEILIEQLKEFTQKVIAEEPEYFLVNVKIKPTNNVKVYLDGDNGITIEKCIKVNRALYKLIEESGLLPADNFSLEVSSPGLDSPLLLHRQYVKNQGRLLEVTLPEEVEVIGKLIEVKEDSIILEVTTGKGKKMVVTYQEIPLADIKKAIIQVQF